MNPETQQVQGLPESYNIRPTRLEDAEGVARLWEIISAENGIKVQANAENFRAEWVEPKFDLESSSRVVTDGDGQIIAYCIFWDNSEIPVDPFLITYIHPTHNEQGIEDYLLNWLEQTAERAIERCPADAQIKYRSMCNSEAKAHSRLLERHGFTQIRSSYHMLIEMNTAPVKTELPQGISVRSFKYPDELEAVIRVDTESFRDMWGFVERPIEEDLPRWQHEIETTPDFDANFWFLAIDDSNQEIIGLCLCLPTEWNNPENAYINSVGVLRPYRRRGIARALLLHAFSELYQRGHKRIALHVDAESLTGATALYEQVGMKADETWLKYEKIIRAGKSLATTSVEES